MNKNKILDAKISVVKTFFTVSANILRSSSIYALMSSEMFVYNKHIEEHFKVCETTKNSDCNAL